MIPVKLPISVHVFKFREQWFVFDVRNFSIIRVNPHGVAVISRMNTCALEQIVRELSPELGAEVVKANYLRFLELIRDEG